MASRDDPARRGARRADGAAETPAPTSSHVRPTPLSGPAAGVPRESRSRALTRYRARVDVEMDDTAVSRVRDPSVSLRLDPPRPAAPQPGALRALLVGMAVGVAAVALALLIGRLLGG